LKLLDYPFKYGLLEVGKGNASRCKTSVRFFELTGELGTCFESVGALVIKIPPAEVLACGVDLDRANNSR
jgi:hypothetical protein